MTRAAVILMLCLTWAGCTTYEARPLHPERSAASLEERHLQDPALHEFLEECLGHPCPTWPIRAWNMDMLVLASLHFHPEMALARAQTGVAMAGTITAGGRPNPSVSLIPGYTQNAAAGVSPWFPLVSFDVPLETASKRSKRQRAAGFSVEAARWKTMATAWNLRARVQETVLERAALQEKTRVLADLAAWQRETVARLEQAAAAGSVAGHEVTPARLARAKAEAELATAQRQAATVDIRLAEALGVPSSSIATLEVDFAWPDQPVEPTPVPLASARSLALQGRADVRAALAEYATVEAQLELEVAKQYPDIHLGPGYQFDQGDHKWSLGLTVELPLLNGNQGPIAEAEARRRESATRFLGLQAHILHEIDLALAGRATALAQWQRLEEAQGLAHGRTEALEKQITAGAADRSAWTEARIEEGVLALSLLEARVQAALATFQLENAIQQPPISWIGLGRSKAVNGKEHP